MICRMPSPYGRRVAAAVFVFVLSISPVANADTAQYPTNPFTDALQFWSAIVASIDSLAHELATAFIPHQSHLTDSSNPHAPNNVNAPPVAANAFTAAVADAIPNTATSSQTNSAATSDQTTPSALKSPAAAPAFQSSPVTERTIIEQVPADTSTFVTQSQFNIALAQLGASLQQFVETNAFNAAASPPLGGGSPNTIAAASAINNLSGVTITNSSLTVSEIPDLSSKYLPFAGGTLAGDLVIDGNATTTDLFATNAATDNLSTGVFSATGTSTLAGINLPNDNCSSYGNGGKLTTDAFGNVVCAADQGGAGSTVAGSDTDIQFNSDGSFAASSNFTFSSSTNTLTVTNASTTNLIADGATSTSFFSTFATLTTGLINTLSGTTLTYTAASTTNISASGEAYFATASTTNLTATNVTTTNIAVSSIASTSNLVVSNGFTFGSLSGFLKAVGGVVTTSLVNLASDVTGVLPVANGGTGTSTTPSYGQVLIGNASGGYSLAATSSLGLASFSASSPLSYNSSTGAFSIQQASGSQNGYLASSDWTNFNNKVSSTSLSGTYPLAYNSSTGVFSTSFSTTTNNTYSGTNTFNGQVTLTTASSTAFTATNLDASTASTSNLTVSNIQNNLLYTNTAGVVSAPPPSRSASGAPAPPPSPAS
jgi:hypothetical protein